MERITEIVLDRPFTEPTLMVINVRRTRMCALRVWVGARLIYTASRVLGLPIEIDLIPYDDGKVLH